MSEISIVTWNINGVRARADAMINWVNENKPDVLCLQEVKASEEQIPDNVQALAASYRFFWNGSTVKKGYSGTGIWVKRTLIDRLGFTPNWNVPSFDIENRIAEIELGNYVIIGVYTPRGEKEDHYKIKLNFLSHLSEHISKHLAEKKEVILCGDMNVAHKDIDVYYPKIDPTMVGLRPDERTAISNLIDVGLTDVFRHLYPDAKDVFTWWPYWRGAREKNMGWRIDCFYTTHDMMKKIHDVVVHTKEMSSDHAPVSLLLQTK